MKRARRLSLVLGMAVVGALFPTTEASATRPPPTTVSPAGDYIKAVVKSGTTMELTGATCTAATSLPVAPVGTNDKNQIPLTGNPTTGGPVIVPLRHPTLSGCSYPTAIAMTGKTSGAWMLALQHKNDGSTAATIKIPKAGLELDAVFPGQRCTVTYAPTALVKLPGQWTGGNPATIVVSNITVPIHVSGDCGDFDGTANVSFTWVFKDVSIPGTKIVVS